jgi:hypothetical protein
LFQIEPIEIERTADRSLAFVVFGRASSNDGLMGVA